jgi:L-fucose isomerase-like protein
MKEITVGYMGLSKASWKTPKICGLMDQALASLNTLPVKVVSAPELTTTEAEAIELSEKFVREGVNVVIMHFASFPVGAIIPAVAQRIKVPIILFANPEEPEAGGVWSQNSFCGANMAAYVLNKMDCKYRFAWGKSEVLAETVKSELSVVTAVDTLANTRIGLVGGRVPGFYTSNFDEMKLRSSFGTTVELIDLIELVETAKNISGEELAEGVNAVRESASGICAVSDKELEQAGNLFMAFRKLAVKYDLDSFAIRCWPEFSDIYGIAPCAVIGMLNDVGIAASCEGDIPGALTMKLQQALAGGGFPFFVDLISFDYNDNTGVVWHCGAAPSKLCRRFDETVLCKHGRVDGGDKKGVTNEFSLKPGRVTMAKIDETPDGYRMLIAPGTALDTDKFIRGNPLRIKFDGDMKALISTIMNKGFEHHYSVIHADVKDELLAFCEIMNISPIVIE